MSDDPLVPEDDSDSPDETPVLGEDETPESEGDETLKEKEKYTISEEMKTLLLEDDESPASGDDEVADSEEEEVAVEVATAPEREDPPLQKKEARVKGIVDLVFLMDATGSMQPCIDALKENIVMFMGLLESGADANSASVIKDWRARVCAFRDVKEDREDWFVDNPFVTDSASLESQLVELEAKGGGDEPESLLDGLHKVASCGATEKGDLPEPLKWRHRHDAARCVVVFTDATYHEEMLYDEGRGGGYEEVKRAVVQSRIILSLFAPDFPCYLTLSKIARCEWEAIPFDEDDKSGPANALKEFTSDEANFVETLEQLAKSVAESTTEVL